MMITNLLRKRHEGNAKIKVSLSERFKRKDQYDHTQQSAKLNGFLQWSKERNYFKGIGRHKIKKGFKYKVSLGNIMITKFCKKAN